MDENYEYTSYATYVFMKRSRGIIRIDAYDHDTKQLEMSVIYGEPEMEEASYLINQTISSKNFLTLKESAKEIIKETIKEEYQKPEIIEEGSIKKDDGINFLDN